MLGQHSAVGRTQTAIKALLAGPLQRAWFSFAPCLLYTSHAALALAQGESMLVSLAAASCCFNSNSRSCSPCSTPDTSRSTLLPMLRFAVLCCPVLCLAMHPAQVWEQLDEVGEDSDEEEDENEEGNADQDDQPGGCTA